MLLSVVVDAHLGKTSVNVVSSMNLWIMHEGK